jgi:large subunit ribosomal protein L29
MKAADVRNMTVEEAGRKLDEIYQRLFELRFQRASGQVKNTAQFSQLKRDIARLKTYLREQEIAAWYASQQNEEA